MSSLSQFKRILKAPIFSETIPTDFFTARNKNYIYVIRCLVKYKLLTKFVIKYHGKWVLFGYITVLLTCSVRILCFVLLINEKLL